MKYAYYPGCSSDGLASAYEQSLKQVVDLFGLSMETIPDWNCCGATEYMSVNRIGAYSLIARNLALVPEGCDQVITSCAACYLNLKKTDKVMHEHRQINDDVNEALSAGGLSYEPGQLKVRHVLDVIINDIGMDAIKEQVVKPLENLNVAPYYGCMLIRPKDSFDDYEYPGTMDTLLSALGANVVDFSMKGYCCGGHMPQIKAATGYEILRRILKDAYDKGANLIAVACPVCQMNLDAYQEDVNRQFKTKYKIPILFFTQLTGLALGMSRSSLGIGKELVSAEKVLAAKPDAKVDPLSDDTSNTRSKTVLPMPSIERGGLQDEQQNRRLYM